MDGGVKSAWSDWVRVDCEHERWDWRRQDVSNDLLWGRFERIS